MKTAVRHGGVSAYGGARTSSQLWAGTRSSTSSPEVGPALGHIWWHVPPRMTRQPAWRGDGPSWPSVAVPGPGRGGEHGQQRPAGPAPALCSAGSSAVLQHHLVLRDGQTRAAPRAAAAPSPGSCCQGQPARKVSQAGGDGDEQAAQRGCWPGAAGTTSPVLLLCAREFPARIPGNIKGCRRSQFLSQMYLASAAGFATSSHGNWASALSLNTCSLSARWLQLCQSLTLGVCTSLEWFPPASPAVSWGHLPYLVRA